GRTIGLGIRPEHLHDAGLTDGAAAGSKLRGRVVTTELLGSELLAHLEVAVAPVVTEEVLEVAEDVDRALSEDLRAEARGQRSDFEEPLDYLETTLPTLVSFEPAAEVLTVSGVEAIRENSRFIVGGAREELYISIWLDDIGDVADELTIAHERGVRIFGMFYGDELPVDSGSWLTHGYRQIVS